MLLRAYSPATSENEIDITGAIVDTEHPTDSDPRVIRTNNGHEDLSAISGDIPELEDGESDDASFIAGAQTAANRKTSKIKAKSITKAGAFQSMGLKSTLLKAISRKGYSVPTPIQRKTIPLILGGQDVVGMARTGSGKTAAFVVPMVEKLKSHSPKIGMRAMILSPSRELALQTMKVVKELCKGTDLRSILLVGGDSLEEQFASMSSNPDIVIGTPGRFLHLKVEMGLDLSSIQYVVFDEADRLFEMGFAAQLTEILHALPSSRQTMLFSATLPKSLVDFAKAGLREPHLVRLDAESKMSQDLQSAFLTLKSAEKEGALLHILHEVIKMPTGLTEAALSAKSQNMDQSKKRKRDQETVSKPKESPTKHSTIIFASTKHHVEYLAALLRQSGFSVSHVYGSLDQTARRIQVQDFRSGMTNILVVTDVAARGIDIPVLANVINYDFPAQPKIFVHRVGRTARAGQKGWSFSLVRDADAPYLLDLQLFLSKDLVLGSQDENSGNFADNVVVGGFPRNQLERSCEWVSKLLNEDADLEALKSVAMKGEKLYLRTRSAASTESARRAKDVTASRGWSAKHPVFIGEADEMESMREQMISKVSRYKPQETIFEIGKRGNGGEGAEIMKKRRDALQNAQAKRANLRDFQSPDLAQPTRGTSATMGDESFDDELPPGLEADSSSISSDEVEIAMSRPTGAKNDGNTNEDSSFFMSYVPKQQNLTEERAYGVHSGSGTNAQFLTAARSATMDLDNDEGSKGLGGSSHTTKMRWDKKEKKYVARVNDVDGSKGAKYVRGESGQKIAASFRSGRYDAWKRTRKIGKIPRTGEMETDTNRSHLQGKRWKHKKDEAPKEADKYRDDYHKRKKRIDNAKEARRGRFRDGSGKNEIKGVDEARKERRLNEKRKEKNGRGRKGRDR